MKTKKAGKSRFAHLAIVFIFIAIVDATYVDEKYMEVYVEQTLTYAVDSKIESKIQEAVKRISSESTEEIQALREENKQLKQTLEKKFYDRGVKTDEKINKLEKNMNGKIDTLGVKVNVLEGLAKTITVDGHNWILIQRRNNVGTNDGFDKTWAQYKDGFGHPSAFWLGLEKMHQTTKSGRWQVLLMGKHKTGSYSGKWGKLVFDNFKIGDEASGYILTFGARLKKENSGTSHHDDLNWHKNYKFTTKDNDSKNCATNRKGGWWYHHCEVIVLNSQNAVWRPDGASSQTLMAMRRT